MDIKEKQARWAKEKPLFEAEFIHSHLLPFFKFNENSGDYEINAESVFNTDDEDQKVAFETLNTGWAMWLRARRAAKTQVPEGFVLVPKSEIGHYYYDESEGMYIDEPDHFLTDLDIGEAQEVKCLGYFDLPSKYAAKVWDEDNQDVDTWELFDTEAEANNVAKHCKAMIEAQEQGHD